MKACLQIILRPDRELIESEDKFAKSIFKGNFIDNFVDNSLIVQRRKFRSRILTVNSDIESNLLSLHFENIISKISIDVFARLDHSVFNTRVFVYVNLTDKNELWLSDFALKLVEELDLKIDFDIY